MMNNQLLQQFLSNRDNNMFWGVYPSWEEAQNAATQFGTLGYDNTDSAALYLHHTRIGEHDYPALYWLYRSLNEGMRSVFDVGGATGIKYQAFREALLPWPQLKWTVQDVPAMVQTGRDLAARDPSLANLSFTDRMADASGHDILFASGVLQYLPASLAEMIADIPQRPRRIIINTTAIHPVLDFFTVNSIGTAFCPYRVQTQATVIRGLSKLGYKLRTSWINPAKLLVIPTHADHCLSQYTGFLLDAK
jgi:putative methyltransferase (TIGR04325 family)